MSRESGRESWIALEREPLPRPPWWFWAAGGALAGSVLLWLAFIAAGHPEPIAAESRHEGVGAFGLLVQGLGNTTVAILGIGLGTGTVVLVAMAARSLLRSDIAGIVAATAMVLEPSFLATAALAVPDVWILAACAGALLAALAGTAQMRWLAGGLVTISSLFDARSAAFAFALLLIVLLRGNIYAAPKHLGGASLQLLAAPLIAAAVSLLTGSGSCAGAETLLLATVPDLGGVAAVGNPALRPAGLAVLAGLAIAALWPVLSSFRAARLPGRIQLRLPDGMPRAAGRALWLTVLMLFAWAPPLWPFVLAMALGLGIAWLAQDAPGFAAGLLLAMVVIGALLVWRTWPFIDGTATAADVDALRAYVPWFRLEACA